MAKKVFYNRHGAKRTALKISLIVLIALIVLAVFLFFYLQRYIVYTAEGVRLNLPILQNAADSAAQ